jgi:membrane-associated phospholipid phosphatase
LAALGVRAIGARVTPSRAVGGVWIGIVGATPKLRKRLGIPRWAALGIVATGPAAVLLGLPRGRVRQYAVFLAQMWGYLRAFELAYADPASLRRRLRVEYPIAVDRALGLGQLPGVRLQRLRRDGRRRRVLDRVLGGVYFAWAAERHAVLLYLLARHPERFPRAAARVAAAFDLGWVIYSALPTAPPWWAAKHGRLAGLHRVTVDVSRDLPLVPEQSEDDDEQGNPWASMPSTHTASAVMLALVAWEADRRVGAAAAGYAAALAIALVYLGEHYVADVLAGAGLAAAINAVAKPG